MDVTVTGAYGRVGTALLDHQRGKFEYTPFDRRDHPRLNTLIGDVSDFKTLEDPFEKSHGVVHLAADPHVDANWESVLQNNIIGGYNCLEACRQCEVETIVLASTNHVVGMYEIEHSPELYETDYELTLDHRTPIRPDSFYGTSKVFLEALGRYYVENYDYPEHVYVLRIGSVRYPKYDHPYGDAERGVENGTWDRESEEYCQSVRRMKATWQSRRDAASLIECCLEDDSVTFDIFYGVSDNERSWFDIEHAREVIGYKPQDSADAWEAPPDDTTSLDSVAFEDP